MCSLQPCTFFFFFNDTATTEIYTLSLHDALPIYQAKGDPCPDRACDPTGKMKRRGKADARGGTIDRIEPGGHRCGGRDSTGQERSEEHTSELQSQSNLVCRLLLEKKKKVTIQRIG